MSKEILSSVPEQIKKALDGRSQRWLAMQLPLPETDFSKRMHGKIDFKKEELAAINKILKSKIKQSEKLLKC